MYLCQYVTMEQCTYLCQYVVIEQCKYLCQFVVVEQCTYLSMCTALHVFTNFIRMTIVQKGHEGDSFHYA